MNERLKILYPMLAKGTINQEELNWLKNYFETGDPEELLLLIRLELQLGDDLSDETTEEYHIFNRIYDQISAERFEAVQPVKQMFKLWPRIASIAAAVTSITLCVWFYYNYNKTVLTNDALVVSQQDVAPGKNAATLTLSDGKIIDLDTNRSMVVVSDSVSTNTTLIASTPRGGTYRFILPDGTHVWLNADSKLEFSSGLARAKTRIVKLVGEGYFEVYKDKMRPFIVESKGQAVEVLGTHFNVNAYNDEPQMTTTLLEGSVMINVDGNKKTINPGEQAINKSGDMKIQHVDVDNVVDWKNGDFYLNHVEFKTAMRKIGRWYDVEIIYDESVPDNMESGGWISREKPLSAVLKSIESSGLVRFKVEGRKIYVMR